MTYHVAWQLLIGVSFVAWCVYARTDRNTERAFRRYNGKTVGELLHEIATNKQGDKK
jgi:hypothetical protein